MMPGTELTHSHAPLPLALFPSGGTWAAIYCVYKGPRSKQKGRSKKKNKKKKKKLSHPRDQTEAAAHPIAELTLTRWGTRDWFPRNQNTLHVHTTQFSPMRRRSVHTHTYIRRAAFEVAAPPLLRTPSVVHARISGENLGW